MRRPIIASLGSLSLAMLACGGAGSKLDVDGGNANDGGGAVDGGHIGDGSGLETASGCEGVFNPMQVLRYDLVLSTADWQTVLGDTSYSIFVQAQFSCGGGTPITVGVRRKRSGGTNKVGLKIDINEFVAGQRYHDLRKLSFENGTSEGSAADTSQAGVFVTEYLGWRLVTLSQMIGGRAALVELYVNGDPLGIYVNVEQVDKRFLHDRLGDDSGWLYKHSGGVDDGFKTHETDGLADPYADYFCFFDKSSMCTPPSEEVLATELPGKLHITQLLTAGAVNAIMANTDGPLFKDNNYYWYDYHLGPRVYLPWDLDTAMNNNLNVITGGVGGQTDIYTSILFPTWEPEYRQILADLLAGPFVEQVIHGELDQTATAGGPAFARDPYLTDSLADAVSALKSYWSARLTEVASQL
jgi:hypothetical protein